jgi:pyruvate dehydrogenase E2 component (dihydrolipoamide acetyltransferase)
MTQDLVMPQLGLTMTEGSVLRWYKNVGDSFTAGEPLFEVETDKVNMDVEATAAGRLVEIIAPLNEIVPVQTVIARYVQE